MRKIATTALALGFIFFCTQDMASAQKFVTKKNKEALGPGTVITPSGLQYKDIKVGSGKAAARGSRVQVHYTGWLYPNGKKFDSSVDRKVPFNFLVGAGQVIKGWDLGVTSMKVGGKRELLIPPELGYGNRRVGPIPKNSTLRFQVELLEVK